MRGYQKKVIFLKNTGSDVFDEAYFVLKNDEKRSFFSHATMVNEAQKIIEENFGSKKKRRKWIVPSLSFLSGVFFTFLIYLTFLSLS